MLRVRKFFTGSALERRLFLTAWAVLLRVRIQLSVQSLERIQSGLSPAPQTRTPEVSVADVVIAIQRASELVPRSTCLVKALTGQILLQNFGYESVMRLGVNKDAQGKFIAHAWLECEGNIILGGAEAANYVLLTSFSSGGPSQTENSPGATSTT